MTSEREERRRPLEDPAEDFKKDVQRVAVRVITENVPLNRLTMRNPDSPDHKALVSAVQKRVVELFDIDENTWPDDGEDDWSGWVAGDEVD